MTRLALVPAGWLAAPDLVSRFCDHLHTLTANPLEAGTAAQVATICIAGALAETRPGVGAFVRSDVEFYMVPADTWRAVIDDHLSGGDSLSLAFTTGRCRGAAFGDHDGLQLLFPYAETMVWLEPGARLAASDRGSDAVRPWRAFNSVKAWLKHPVAATKFADDLLEKQGHTALNERARRRVLDDYLREHGAALGNGTVGANRREGGHTV